MTFPESLLASTARLVEECAEEVGRLDALVSVAPPAVATALQVGAVAQLGAADAEAMQSARASLVAARVEMLHAVALDTRLADWRERMEDGERRARSGAPLAPAAGVVTSSEMAHALSEALRPASVPRPLLLRALHVVAWSPDGAGRAEGEHLAALVLVAGGMTDRVRLLPFMAFGGAERAVAAAAWRDGDPQPLARGALGALAASARQLRLQVRLLIDAQADEDAHLAEIGRAAVTARRALTQLRTTLATSVPDLSERLGLSRPAAGAALERLVSLGLAEEVTGRARDRVFVLAAAWGLV